MNPLPDPSSAVFDLVCAVLLMDLGRYLIGAGGVYLVINVLLAGALQHRKIRPEHPSRIQILTEFLVSMRTVLIFTGVGLLISLGNRYGYLQLHSEPDRYGWVWFALSILVLVVLHDAWFYWMHRLIHRPALFRQTHLRHHKSHNPSPFASYSFDIGEAVLTALYFPLALALIPVSELAAFIFTAHMIVVNALHHSGVEIYPRTRDGKPLLDWLTSTTHHDLHHARGGFNYGFYFTFWDRLMGTEHPEYHQRFKATTMLRSVSIVPKSATSKQQLRRRTANAMIACLLVFAAANTDDLLAANEPEMQSIVGEWASEGYSIVVRLRPCTRDKAALCGDLLWAWSPESILKAAWDHPLLDGFMQRSGTWRSGVLTHPVSGRAYHGSIRQIDVNTLSLEGCIARVICQEQLWHRLQSLPHTR